MISARNLRPAGSASDQSGGLRRLLGVTTVICVGAGNAIGSGIFRTPGELAGMVRSPWGILLLWLLAGALTLLQSLVTAELATRMPKAGGEYQYLKEAYGPFAAFFFGWSFTIFIIGAGAGVIAAALGDFAVSLLGDRLAGWSHEELSLLSRWIGFAAIVLVVAVNAMGLKAGAAAQIVLTVVKVLALFGVGVGALCVAGRLTPRPVGDPGFLTDSGVSTFSLGGIGILLQAMLQAFWPFTGATDSAKLAEETRDVHRAMPRALCATVLLLTILYLFYNYAMLCAMSPGEMAGRADAHAAIFDGIRSVDVRSLILLASMVVCLGALSSVFLANSRVLFAMARDRLTFRFLGNMSGSQAPVATLLVCGAIASTFVLVRGFSEILEIYFVGSTVLFGLTYASLIVFRRRDRRDGRPFPQDAFRLPGGPAIAVLLILVEAGIGVSLIYGNVVTWGGGVGPDGSEIVARYDSLLAIGVLVLLAIVYRIWIAFHPVSPKS